MALSNKFCKRVCDNRIARHHQSMLLSMRRDYHFIIHLWFHHTEYIIYLHIPYYFNIQNHLQIYIAQVIFSLIPLKIFKYLNLAHKIPLIPFVSSIFLLIQTKKNHNINQEYNLHDPNTLTPRQPPNTYFPNNDQTYIHTHWHKNVQAIYLKIIQTDPQHIYWFPYHRQAQANPNPIIPKN